ncbi:hypothetical protein GUJ93_ZPchr0010g10866 [Zizania palustris]|uniref:Uncharacterized protein n=1 Tax=Zizania palustris TaxID=103762 RepID=A0A8J5SZH3_ZIZPA|nr:hypothetical protein GUJ93_ZPchr0010g10866 [Zizania palustris]
MARRLAEASWRPVWGRGAMSGVGRAAVADMWRRSTAEVSWRLVSERSRDRHGEGIRGGGVLEDGVGRGAAASVGRWWQELVVAWC